MRFQPLSLALFLLGAAAASAQTDAAPERARDLSSSYWDGAALGLKAAGAPPAVTPAAAAEVDDRSLQAVNQEVERLRSQVWAGTLAPADFYGKVEAAFTGAYGPGYPAKVRQFLDAQALNRPAQPAGGVDFSRMTGKDRAAFFEKLPKGAELHIHLTGTADPDTLLALADKLEIGLSTSAMARLIREIGLDPAHFRIDASTPAMLVRQLDPALKAAVKKTLVTNDHDKGFLDFLKKWSIIGAVTRPAEANYPLLKALAETSKRQNVLYLEVIVYSGGVNLEQAATDAQRVQRETGVTIRLIAYSSWPDDAQKVDAGMEAAHRLSGRGVVGYNMVADELRFRPLKHYPSFQKLRERMPELSVSVHAGEVPGSADNLVNDLLLNPKRYGHATQVEENPLAMALLYARKTPVEVSLFSNRDTGSMPDIKKHPLPKLLAWKVPVTLSTDDPGIFGTTLSQEYDAAQKSFNLSWEELAEISRNGIRHSFLDEKTKAQLLADLNRRLKQFERSGDFKRYRTK